MEISLKGKQALVCGSTQGIGWGVAQALAAQGASVILLARDEKRLKKRVKELFAARGARHSYLVADFSNPKSVKEAVMQLSAEQSIHILINNTGGPAPGTAIDATPDAFEKAFAQHLVCNQILVQNCVPGMIADRYGRIINIISTSVKIPIPGLGVSNTIRGAVASWAKTLSLELAPNGITVNNILPGFVRTQRLDNLIKSKAEKEQIPAKEMEQKMVGEVPAGRFGQIEDLGNLAAFLASPAASYINGVSIPVDGGRTGTI